MCKRIVTGFSLFWILLLKASVTEGTPMEDLAALADRFLAWRLTESPEFGTKFGIHDRDDEVGEITEEAFLRRKNAAMEYLTEANQIAEDQLDSTDRTSLAILKYNLEAFTSGYQCRLLGQYGPLSPLDPLITNWLGMLKRMKYETADDYRKFLSRLKGIKRQLDQHTFFMREGIDNGKTMHNVSLTGVAKKFVGEVAKNTSSYLYHPLMNIPVAIDENTRLEFQANGSRIIQKELFPAFTNFASFLTEEYAPNTRESEGWSSLPGGMECYQQALSWHLSLDMTPQEVHAKGLNEVDRIQKLMENEMKKYGFNGTLQGYIAHLMSRPENLYSSGQEMIDGYQKIINDTHDKLSQVFNNVPNTPCVVVASSNPQGPGGRYSPPASDGSKPGTFIANVFAHESKPKFNMPALTLHEAEPGHHFWAVSLMSQGDKIPKFRRMIEYRKYYSIPFNFPFFTASSEGWALYAESLGEEIGTYDEPHSLFGRYSSEMFRAARLVVDTGIHAFGWSKSRAMGYFANYTAMGRFAIENEVNRYISWPGQACAYKIGQLKLTGLRQIATEQLGNRFNLKDFHDQILNLGPAPLTLIEDNVNRWIDAQTAEEVDGSATLIKINMHLISGCLISLFMLLTFVI